MKKSEAIPSASVMPLVRRYLNEYQADVGVEAGRLDVNNPCEFAEMGQRGVNGWHVTKQGEQLYFACALEVLAEEAGMSASMLRKQLSGKRQSISFDSVEALLVAMGCTEYWHTDLAEYYEAAA